MPLATLAGFLISVVHGLFGFEETWLAPFAQQAFALEVAAVVVLGVRRRAVRRRRTAVSGRDA